MDLIDLTMCSSQKIVDKMMQKNIAFPASSEKKSSEAAIGDELLDLVVQAHEEGVDAESALRSALKRFETALERTRGNPHPASEDRDESVPPIFLGTL